MKKYYSRGFTLIELLVVIAIIGILSAVVLTSLGTARSKARIASVQQSLHGIQAAANICLNDGLTLTMPSADDNSQSSAICSGSAASYVTLPTGWMWCNITSGTQGSGNCGNEVSSSTAGVSFTIVAESLPTADNAVVSCTESTCTTSTTNPD
jgi:prepilin-type N-terminal cleavage/methylation domain-containing protein